MKTYIMPEVICCVFAEEDILTQSIDTNDLPTLWKEENL